MTNLARLLLRHRGWAATLATVLIAACAAGLRDLRVDFSLDPILQASEADLAQVKDFQAKVPPRFVDVVFVLSWPHPIARADLDLVEEIGEELSRREGVRSVRSLPTTPVVPPGARIPVPAPFPETVGVGETVPEAAWRHPLLRRTMISEDGRSTPLLVKFDMPVTETPSIEQISSAWRTIVEVAGADVEVRRIGGPIVEHAMARSMWTDVGRNLSLEMVLCAVLLAVLFRSARGAALPIVAVLAAIAASAGVLAHLGHSITLIDLAIPGLVTIIGLCDAVHLLHRFEIALAITGRRDAAILDTMARVGPACLHTSLTTALGFLSLLVSRHEAVRAFGMKASISVGVTFLVVIALVPLLLSVWPLGGPRPPRLRFDGASVFRFRRWSIAAFLVAIVIGAAGAMQVRADSFWLEELPPEAPEVVDMHWFEERFSGLLTLDVRLDGPLDDPAVFRAVEALDRAMREHPGITGSESYTWWVREILGNPAELSDDDIRRGVGLLRLTGSHFPRFLIDPGFRHGRLSFRTTDIGTRRFLALCDEVRDRAVGAPSGLRVEPAGYMRMAHESSRLVVTTLLQSFLLSLLTISAFLALLYRSIRIGLITVVPNVFPILLALGVNGLLDIPLRIGIVMIYSLGLGLAVDDTIHLVTRFFQERDADPAGEARHWAERALEGTGRALLLTSAILVVGCLCYLPSSFRSMVDVGKLLSVVVVTALLADLYLLPLLLEWRYRRDPSDAAVGGGDVSSGAIVQE